MYTKNVCVIGHYPTKRKYLFRYLYILYIYIYLDYLDISTELIKKAFIEISFLISEKNSLKKKKMLVFLIKMQLPKSLICFTAYQQLF